MEDFSVRFNLKFEGNITDSHQIDLYDLSQSLVGFQRSLALTTHLYKIGTAPRDTVLGHLIHSAYDYVIKENLGFHVDFNQTLGQQYEKIKREKLDIKRLA